MSRKKQIIPVVLAVALAPLAVMAFDEPDEIKTQFFKGKVVPLAEVLKDFGAKLDPDAKPHWLALVTDEGKVYPLIKDAGSRMFFKDKELLKRPMRLTGRLYPDTNLLQVVQVNSYKDGKLHEVFYWCDVCSIRTYEPGICDCCGDETFRREEPVK